MTADATWLESMPEVYDRCLGPALFEPYAHRVAALVARRTPRTVLELAAGTGILTRELLRALPRTVVTATDLNPAMVAWAAGRAPGATWLPADAQRLDFPDESFDVVACQFGVMFFPDKPAAFAQAARVLRPGGSMIMTVWDSLETSDLPAAYMAALARMLPERSPDFMARIPHGYADPDQVRRDIRAGGLRVEDCERVVLRGRAESAGSIAEGFSLGTPLRFALEQRGDLGDLTARLAADLTDRLGAGPIDGELAAFLLAARKPS